MLESVNREQLFEELLDLKASLIPGQDGEYLWQQLKRHDKRLRALLPKDIELASNISPSFLRQLLDLLDELREKHQLGAESGRIDHYPVREIDYIDYRSLRRLIQELAPVGPLPDVQGTGVTADEPEVECLVTLQQAAAMVSRSKRTLEDYKRKDQTMPLPRVEGGGGKPAEWAWSEIRSWLEKTFDRSLPKRFPADRFRPTLCQQRRPEAPRPTPRPAMR